MKEWYTKMNYKTKRELQNKARLACGLADILKYDAENLVTELNELYEDYFVDAIRDTKETMQNFVDTITEMEHLLYMERFKES